MRIAAPAHDVQAPRQVSLLHTAMPSLLRGAKALGSRSMASAWNLSGLLPTEVP